MHDQILLRVRRHRRQLFLQGRDRIIGPDHGPHPDLIGHAAQHLVHDGITQRLLVGKMVVQGPLGQPGVFQNAVQAGALEAVAVDFLKCRHQQGLAGLIGIAFNGHRTRYLTALHRLLLQVYPTASRGEAHD